MLLFVVNSKLTYFPHQIDYRICAAYIVFIVYCLWGAAEHLLSGAIVSCSDDDDDDDDTDQVTSGKGLPLSLHSKVAFPSSLTSLFTGFTTNTGGSIFSIRTINSILMSYTVQ